MYNQEFENIIYDIINNKKFKKLQNQVHHYTTNRYDHCLSISYRTYKICKYLNLDYVSATRASLVHDFFFDEEITNKKFKRLVTHYKKSIDNANKIIDLSKKEENIIAAHMFPFGGEIPKHLESVIVDLVDDVISVKERFIGDIKRFATIGNFVALVFINFIK